MTENPRRFLSPQAISRISRLDLRARRVVEGFISGMHKSPFFGHSVEFVQHRDYTPGDDIRHLDWKVWSKTDRFYIKQFEAETNLRAMLLLDVSESMRYGRGPMTKYDYACTMAASLAYMLLHQGDAVGCMTFDNQLRQAVPARSHLTHLDSILQSMHVSKPAEKTNLKSILQRVSESLPGRGMVILISDLLTDRPELFAGLDLIRHRRHDVIVFHVLDEDEVNFDFQGTTRFLGMEAMPDLVCDPRALRQGYLEVLNEYLDEVRRGCASHGIEYSLIRTSDYLDAVLARFLASRMALRGRK
ncbi:MAG: DUF58 domain-containing protein [Planctomycetia bacterium]|nr:DUF58 domain-containing protein [Planctomycetia bacterium]